MGAHVPVTWQSDHRGFRPIPLNSRHLRPEPFRAHLGQLRATFAAETIAGHMQLLASSLALTSTTYSMTEPAKGYTASEHEDTPPEVSPATIRLPSGATQPA